MTGSLDVSRAYRLIKQVAKRSGEFSQSEIDELAAEEDSATSDIDADSIRFLTQLDKAERALKERDYSALSASLVGMRIAVMRVAADLDNLREVVDLLYRRSAIAKLKEVSTDKIK